MDHASDEKKKDSIFQMKRALKSLLSRLYEGLYPHVYRFSYLIPSQLSSFWFFHHSIGDRAVFHVPPNLIDDDRWVGLELYVIFTKRPSIYSSDFCSRLPSKIVFDIYAHGVTAVPVLSYSVVVRDDPVGSLCMVSHVPRLNFPQLLNQSQGISILVKPVSKNIDIEMCGTKLLFEQDLDFFIQAIVEPTFARPDVLHILHDEAQICPESEVCDGIRVVKPSGYFFYEEWDVIETLQKLLTSKLLEEQETPNPLFKCRLSLAPKYDYKEFETISLRSKNLFLDDWDCIEGANGEDTSRNYSFNHLNIMIETLLDSIKQKRDSIIWKRDLEFILEDFFKSRTFVTLSLKEHVISTLRPFDPFSTYNICFPHKEILRLFEQECSASTVRIKLPPNLYSNNNWIGIVICSAFSVNERLTSSKTSFKLRCNLTSNGCRLNIVPVFSISKDKFKWSYTRGFIWLTFIPHALLSELNQRTFVEAGVFHDCSDFKLKKCGMRLLYEKDVEEFKQTIIYCWTSLFDNLGPINDFVADHDEFYQRRKKIGTSAFCKLKQKILKCFTCNTTGGVKYS